MPKPAVALEQQLNGSAKLAQHKMDKPGRKPSNGQKGPFTVDSGGGKRGQAIQGRTTSGARRSNPATPVPSPASTGRSGFQYPPQPFAIPHARHNRGNSTAGSASFASSSTPTFASPIDPSSSRYTPAPTSSFPYPMAVHSGSQFSTTPLDAPPAGWANQNIHQAAALQDWNNPGPSSWTYSPQADDLVNGGLDDATIARLTELLEQETHQQVTNTGGFDLLAALEAPAAGPQTGPSLLSQRLQQHQQQHSYPETTSSSYMSASQSYTNSPLSTTPITQTSLGDIGSISGPTPPQSYSSAFSYPTRSGPGPMTPWPLDQRSVAFVETPVTTPGGSDHGVGSPYVVSIEFQMWGMLRADITDTRQQD